MLMAGCETARAFASMLSIVTDRMAILCTSPINEHRTLGCDYTTVWPLSPVRTSKLKHVLDAVSGSSSQISPNSWGNTIDVATDMLLRSPALGLETETVQDTYGMVIILTADGTGIPSRAMIHDKLQFHVICPTNIPQSNFGAIYCNGWKLRSTSSKEPRVVRSIHQRLEPNSLVRKLRDLIQYARGGKSVGRLTYLSLDIKAASHCTIQEMIGQTELMTLQPGEEHTVLVRVKVNGSFDQDASLSRAFQLPELGPDSLDVLDKINEMLSLNPKPMKVLTARLRYKHSLLPTNTVCDTHKDCRLKRVSQHYADEMHPTKRIASELPECTVSVHERLAYHLATSVSLCAFRREFGEDGWRSLCPNYTRMLLNELKYQARVKDRLEMNNSPQKRILPLKIAVHHPQDRLRLVPSPDSSSSEEFKPVDWLTDIHDQGESETSHVESMIHPNTDNSRKRSKGFRLRHIGRSASSRHNSVISRKRSMATLRSISFQESS